MSKRNIAWLVGVIAAGLFVWLTAGVIWGLIAAGVTLLVSEVIERRARQRRKSAKMS